MVMVNLDLTLKTLKWFFADLNVVLTVISIQSGLISYHLGLISSVCTLRVPVTGK